MPGSSQVPAVYNAVNTLYQNAQLRDAHQLAHAGLSSEDLRAISAAVRALANDPQAAELRAALAQRSIGSTFSGGTATAQDLAALLETIWHDEYYAHSMFAPEMPDILAFGQTLDAMQTSALKDSSALSRRVLGSVAASVISPAAALARR